VASFVTSVLIPFRKLRRPSAEAALAQPVEAGRPAALGCRGVRDERSGRPVARWVAEPDVAEEVAPYLRSSDRRVA
jgi:hypothetical protein